MIKKPGRPRFVPNISRTGRLVRGIFAMVLLGAAVFTWHVHWLISAALLCGGIFLLFEALRGWCGLRACGIKTPL
jgi:hypothetical protein